MSAAPSHAKKPHYTANKPKRAYRPCLRKRLYISVYKGGARKTRRQIFVDNSPISAYPFYPYSLLRPAEQQQLSHLLIGTARNWSSMLPPCTSEEDTLPDATARVRHFEGEKTSRQQQPLTTRICFGRVYRCVRWF